MSYLLNDPAAFADEATAGFVAAHADVVRRVAGGVARRSATPKGQVAIVVGGGSGHYPAFAGLVGPGLAHGAALGNVFASPSAVQVHDVATAVEAGAGVLLTYGNYAGDVLNFDQAQDRLIGEGIPCRTVTVTDDLSSAEVGEREKRRGVAGDLVVFRAAAWAAEQGWDLDAVHAFASRANDRCRTLGVAFSGTTLPGADEPLFTVPKGRMAVGMGIHGEAGIGEGPLPTAEALADLLVDRLLTERPDDAGSAAVVPIVNGLGAVKGEELFVLYGAVARLLEAAGLRIVEPEVGEFATSFEMAGVSLTLLWLDDELEAAWHSPAAAPGYRKGNAAVADTERLDDETDADAEADVPEASAGSRAAAATVVAGIDAVRQAIDEQADELGRLDAIAGDGDHGIGMQRGATAAADAAHRAADRGAGAGSVLAFAGDAWAHRAGGTSGALWGAALRAAGERLGDTDVPDGAAVSAAVDAAKDAVTRYGKARLGDKTLVDALVPFAERLAQAVQSGDSLGAAWAAAADAAGSAADATADLTPRLGRARPHVEKSLGTPDPGAVSFALAMKSVAEVRTAKEGSPA